jgi:hypothetical protein
MLRDTAAALSLVTLALGHRPPLVAHLIKGYEATVSTEKSFN